MTYNPQRHHRQSIRLKGYNYAQTGLYFITICTQDRLHLFGQITEGQMILNDAGIVAADCWQAIPAHFPDMALHEYIVMPNHIHWIIEIKNANIVPPVGVENFQPLPAVAENRFPEGYSPICRVYCTWI